jgi:hypothetical protein
METMYGFVESAELQISSILHRAHAQHVGTQETMILDVARTLATTRLLFPIIPDPPTYLKSATTFGLALVVVRRILTGAMSNVPYAGR